MDTNTGAVTQTFPDHSLRSTAVPAASLGFYRQDVTFYRPGTCCNNAWTESGGTVSVSHTLSMAIETAALLCRKLWCGVGTPRTLQITLATREQLWAGPSHQAQAQTV